MPYSKYSIRIIDFGKSTIDKHSDKHKCSDIFFLLNKIKNLLCVFNTMENCDKNYYENLLFLKNFFDDVLNSANIFDPIDILTHIFFNDFKSDHSKICCNKL